MWMILSESDLTSALTAPELDLFSSGASSSSSPDRLAAIVVQVVSLVRGKVAAWPENLAKMGPGASPAVGLTPAVLGTIPEELFGDAIEIARFKLLTSFPQGKMFLDDARMEGFRAANKHLDDAANGKLIIEPAPSTTETGAQFDPSVVAWGDRGRRENCDRGRGENWSFWL
jgi:hypothetical protein